MNTTTMVKLKRKRDSHEPPISAKRERQETADLKGNEFTRVNVSANGNILPPYDETGEKEITITSILINPPPPKSNSSRRRHLGSLGEELFEEDRKRIPKMKSRSHSMTKRTRSLTNLYRAMNESQASEQRPTVRKDETKFNWSLAISLFAVYASFTFCRNFFTVTQAAIKHDMSPTAIGLTDRQANNIVISFVIAFGISKIPGSVLVGSTSPKLVLFICMAMTSGLVYFGSFAENFNQLRFIAILNAVPQATAMPATTQIITDDFPVNQRARAFTVVSMASRLGTVAVSIGLGEVLRWSGDWRLAVRAASLVMAAVTVIIMSLGVLKKKVAREDEGGAEVVSSSDERFSDSDSSWQSSSLSETEGEQPQQFRKSRGEVGVLSLFCRPRFWLLNIATAMLIVSKNFDTYAVMFITDTCRKVETLCGDNDNAGGYLSAGQNTCAQFAPQVTSCISLGIIASLAIGASSFEYIRKQTKDVQWRQDLLVIILCGLNALSAAVLYTLDRNISHGDKGWCSSSSEENGGGMKTTAFLACVSGALFLLGFTSGFPFYLPQSLYAAEFGKASGMVSGCGEAIQSILGGAFIYGVQSYAVDAGSNTNWEVVWNAIVWAGVIATLFMASFLYLSPSRKARRIHRRRHKRD